MPMLFPVNLGGSLGGGGGGALSAFSGDFATRPWAGAATGPGGLYDATADKTYFGWISDAGPSVARAACYDHATDSFSDPVTIGTSNLTDDDHGSVALCLLSDNRLVAFWGSHNGNQQWAISGTSDGEADITDWTEQTELSGSKFTYPKPVNIPDGSGGGTLWLIYRKGDQADGNLPLCVRSAAYTSGGALFFGAETTLVDLDGGSGARVYAGEVRATDATSSADIEFMWTRSTLTDSSRHHVYYGKLVLSSGSISSLDNLSGGTSTAAASLPVDLTNANSNYREVTSANEADIPSWCRDTSGDLHILYIDDSASPYDLKHNIHSGGSWGTAATVASVIDQSTGDGFKEIYCLVAGASGKVEAWYPQGDTGGWTTRGGDSMARKVRSGGTWGSEETIHTGTNSRALGHPISILNAHADFRVMFSEVAQSAIYGDRALMERYAYGDSAFLQWPSLTNSFWPHVVEQIRYVGANGATPTDLDESVASQPLAWNGDADIQSNRLSLDGTGDEVVVGLSTNAGTRRYNFDEFFVFVPGVKITNTSNAQQIWTRFGASGDRSIAITYHANLSPKRIRVYLSTNGTDLSAPNGLILEHEVTLDTGTEYDLLVTRDASDTVRLHFGERGAALSMVASGSLSGRLSAEPQPVRHGSYGPGQHLTGSIEGARAIATDMGVGDSDYTPEAAASWTMN